MVLALKTLVEPAAVVLTIKLPTLVCVSSVESPKDVEPVASIMRRCHYFDLACAIRTLDVPY